ncbi:RNA polymerase sigma factor [Kitasatospora azatica]|uniref:RNA polymerase sigma factor n=1 Tax=Kitasatospora azatica TaxID=58347 RepID=UPI000566522E|nr:RNA polymerase sigma factor [Kitasatospora azatica]
MHEPPPGLAELVRAAQGGDQLAAGRLLDLITPYVRRLCGPIALEDGADATQEALIAVFRKLRQLQDPLALYGWVRAIAVREAVRHAQRAARQRPAELAEVPAPGDPQLAADIRDVLARLSPEHRAVLLLRDLEGIDERRTAELLAVPPGTVKSRLSRARLSFRKAWSQ